MDLSYDVHTFPAALRMLADDIESLAGQELADTRLLVSLQVVRFNADEDTRLAAVTRLASSLGSHAEVIEEIRHYGTPHTATRHGAQINVFTALDKVEGGESS